MQRQASVILALRAAKRVGILVDLRRLATELVGAGFNDALRDWNGNREALNSASAARNAVDATIGLPPFLVVDAVFNAVNYAAEALAYILAAESGDPAFVVTKNKIWELVLLDVSKIEEISKSPGSIALTGWDDPRLGPLWPDGLPEWHHKAEQLVGELKAKLAARPDPFAPPIHAHASTQLANYHRLAELARTGALNSYRGEYVAVLNGELVGHDPDGEKLLKRIAEERGEAAILVACRYLD